MNNLAEFHKLSSYHKGMLENTQKCGCFYCMKVFKPSLIEEWIDNGQTAICPYCKIDSVLPQTESVIITTKLLEDMHNYWFKVVA